jgi:hypothetical protein
MSKWQAYPRVALKTKDQTPQNMGFVHPWRRLGCIFEVPIYKHQNTNKSQITIFNVYNNGTNVNVKREPLNSGPVTIEKIRTLTNTERVYYAQLVRDWILTID